MTKMGNSVEDDGGVSAVMSGLSVGLGRLTRVQPIQSGTCSVSPPPPENPGARLSRCTPPREPHAA